MFYSQVSYLHLSKFGESANYKICEVIIDITVNQKFWSNIGATKDKRLPLVFSSIAKTGNQFQMALRFW